MVVEANGAKHKVFWDEVESVKKPEKHVESAAKPSHKEHGLVDSDEAHKALEAAGWKAPAKGITTNSHEHPDHPGHVIGLSSDGAWAHNPVQGRGRGREVSGRRRRLRREAERGGGRRRWGKPAGQAKERPGARHVPPRRRGLLEPEQARFRVQLPGTACRLSAFAALHL